MSFLDEYRSVETVLDELDHTFRIGLSGFGTLGQTIFALAWKWPHIDIVAVNDPSVTALSAVDLFKADQHRTHFGDVTIEASSPNTLIFQNDTQKMGVAFLSQREPEKISWKSYRVLHVIESLENFNSFAAASRHLHRAMSFDEEIEYERSNKRSIWDDGGAMKVLIAGRPTQEEDVKTFWPGTNERKCLFEDYVVAYAPPPTYAAKEEDMWEYASQVLKLLNVILCRDGSVASQLAWMEEGRGGWGLPEGKSPLHVSMERALNWNLPGAERPWERGWGPGWKEGKKTMEECFVRAADSEWIDVVGKCGKCGLGAVMGETREGL